MVICVRRRFKRTIVKRIDFKSVDYLEAFELNRFVFIGANLNIKFLKLDAISK